MQHSLETPNSTVSSSSRSPTSSISAPASLISPIPCVSHVFLKENDHPGRRYVHQGSKWQFTRQSEYRIGLCLRSIHLESFLGYYCVCKIMLDQARKPAATCHWLRQRNNDCQFQTSTNQEWILPLTRNTRRLTNVQEDLYHLQISWKARVSCIVFFGFSISRAFSIDFRVPFLKTWLRQRTQRRPRQHHRRYWKRQGEYGRCPARYIPQGRIVCVFSFPSGNLADGFPEENMWGNSPRHWRSYATYIPPCELRAEHCLMVESVNGAGSEW